MTVKKLGRQTLAFAGPPTIAGCASVVGKKEGQGPLAAFFDLINQDVVFNQKTNDGRTMEMERYERGTGIQVGFSYNL